MTALNYNLPIHVRDQQRAPRRIGRNTGDQVFRSAARHSRLVRFLRFSIPAVILVIAGVIVAAPYVRSSKAPIFPVYDGLTLSGTKIVMERPRLTGFTTDGRPYEMIARTAAQDFIRQPDILELKNIDAKVELQNGQHVTITSINGIYDTKREVLKLNDHITLNTNTGYEGRLSEATVYVASSRVVSENPVEMKLPNGLLHANRLEVTENGAVIVFGGGVEMDLDPQQPQPRAATQDSADAGPPAQTAPVHTAPMQTTARRSTSSQ